jgi:acyl-CoA thioester hydrolase
LTAVASLLTLHRFVVPAAFVDYNKHMADGYYTVIFSDATTALMAHIGLGPVERETTGRTLFTLEMHTNYLLEVKLGTEVRVDTQILGYDAKRLHVFHTMHRGDEAEAVCTNEQMLLNIDMSGPKAAPFLPEVAARLEAIWQIHKDLPRPRNAGRSIGLPSKKD